MLRRIKIISSSLIILAFVAGTGGLAWRAVWHRGQPPSLPDPPLKSLAARHQLELGNFAMSNYLDDRQYSSILSGQYDLAIIDNTPNWYFTDGGLRPGRNRYDFATMDHVVAYAQEHAMSIQAHHLLWGDEKWLPDWLKNGNYDSSTLRTIQREHIATVASHYHGRIKEWSVVNEAFSRQLHVNGLHDWWADHAGGQAYIADAFRQARQADPTARLILNDFGNEQPGPIADAMYAYIKQARADGVPIDGIGLQTHIDGRHPPTKDEVIATMQRYASLGIGVYVTEFDVNMSNVAASDRDRDNIQADIYYEMARACIESRACKSFAQLGITDKETWYNYLDQASQQARPLMFDALYQPKPAFFAFRNALQQP